MFILNDDLKAEIEVKKSRFISNVFYVKDEIEAIEKINLIKKEYYDAKHNCYAYIVNVNENKKKQSDDGEPSGTAGLPILNILENNNLINCIAIVTRYFGGILLGTGGLKRAYTDAVIKSFENIKKSEVVDGINCTIKLNYNDYQKFERMIEKNLISTDNKFYISEKSFDDNVIIKYYSDKNVNVDLIIKLKNLSNGNCDIIDNKNCIYSIKNKQIVIF